MPKAIVIIADGISDRPIKALGNKTPLEVAATPNLDRLAVDGISGMMHTVDIGVRPGSDTAHLALFGYDPVTYYTGRGPYECLAIGMEVLPGDVALRANAGTVDQQGVVIDRRAGRIESTDAIAAALDGTTIDGVKFILKKSLGHRLGLVARGPGLSYRVSDQDPHTTGVALLTVKPLDNSPEAQFTAGALNTFSRQAHEVLDRLPFNQQRVTEGKLPANAILFRGAGVLPRELLSFQDKYRLKTAFIAGAPMYKGIATALGMDVVTFDPADGVTGLADSNISAKINRAIALLAEYDLVFVHIKAADTLAEDGNYQGKAAFIEKIDRALAPLVDRPDILVVVTADHTTASELKIHTADPVPITIRGEGVRTDDLGAFSERECAKGRLGTIRGQNLMPILVDLLGIAQMYGA